MSDLEYDWSDDDWSDDDWRDTSEERGYTSTLVETP